MLKTSKDIKSDLIVIKFDGVWYDDKNSEGKLLYKNGAKYTGQIKNMMRHGKGDYIYPNLEDQNRLKVQNLIPLLDKNEFDRKSFSGEWNED
jgi:hypothetical protein